MWNKYFRLPRKGITVVIAIIVLITVAIISALLGQHLADKQWRKTMGLNAMVRIYMDLRFLRYWEAKNHDAIKNLLDSDLDSNLELVIGADSLLADDPVYVRLRDRELVTLREYWEKHVPAKIEFKSEDLAKAWRDHRTKQNEFLSNVTDRNQ